ncbi:MAG: sigma 54-interacting transcriptional regulator [Flaviramulus sp.]|nr:sigma 54-interacting transcriptional regulator [Flaviramulus sp.]NNC51112.1 sigma 54-interacting transcriptional regulator [Flaviramulus sp.]
MKTILIVDDTFENLYLLRVIFEQAGYTVVEANDGKEGIHKLQKNNIDLIISDILMPVMDGYMFCQACKKDKAFKDIPFVFYTSTYTAKPDEDFALKLGASHFLRKPTDPDKILEIAEKIFTEKKPVEKLTKKVKVQFSEEEVLKLYSKRLISKLEHKNLDLEKEVAERKKAEQKLKNENEILDLITKNKSLKDIFDHIIFDYESLNLGYFGSISLLDNDGIHLDLISAPTMPKSFNLAVKRGKIGKYAGSCGTAAFLKKPVIVSDISTSELWVDYKDLALKHNFKSCWSIPLLSEANNVLGTFAIYGTSIKSPSLVDIKELNSVVNLAKIAIVKFNITAEVKKKDESYKSLINQASDGIVTYSGNGVIHDFNKASYENLGYSRNEFSKLKIQDFIAGEFIKNPKRHKNILEGKSELFERQLIRKDGTLVDAEISSKLQKDGRILGIIRDITERRKAELELKHAKEFTDKLIMSMQEGLIIVNLEGKVVMVNDSICKILGYTRTELVGQNMPYPYVADNDAEKFSKTYKKVAEGETLSFNVLFIRKNGEKFMASFLTGNIKNDEGEVIALFGTVKDVSEEEKAKKVLEEKAKQSQERKNVILELASLVGSDYNKALKKITSLSAQTLNIDRVSVLKFINSRSEIYCENLYIQKNNTFESGLVLKKENSEDYFNNLSQNIIVNATDALNNKITEGFAKDYLLPAGIRSKLSIPIQGVDEVYGILCFEQVEKRRKWNSEDEEFATSIANLISLMVESAVRKMAEKELVLKNKELNETLHEINDLKSQLEQENTYLRNELDLVFNYEDMVYGSSEFSNVLSEVEKVAPTNATVLLLGESGTGKELLAKAIHNTSLRNKRPLIKVNCSAIPRELIESELFGHKKGSFTGAFADKIGKFEMADGGTLFLDEIGELPLDMQPKILRFLQEGEIEVVGGTTLKKLDVRVIAATNRNLKVEIEKKAFREDLYFRLNVFPIEVPPLRKRKDDIPLLIEHFIDKFNKAYDKKLKFIPEDSMRKLKSYEWPGNIRELENLVERAAILSNNDTLLVPGFESTVQIAKKQINNKDLSLDLAQRIHILHVLEQCNWKISGSRGASEILDIKPSTLRDKMQKLGITKPSKN